MSSRGHLDGNRIELRLETRIKERAQLLARTKMILERDARIRAAWLTGSLARNDQDALSDVDLWIVVADEFIGSVIEERRQYVARVDTPVLVLENLTNAPPLGAYLLVHYPGAVGPQHFDWFWQPESLATYPSNGKLLFDRADLAVADGGEWQDQMHQEGNRPPIDETDMWSVLAHKNSFFWAMSLTVAKYIARRDGETVDRMMKVVARTLGETSRLLDVPTVEIDRIFSTEVASLTATEQLEMLQSLARISADMQPEIVSHAQSLPTGAIEQIIDFFELTRDMVGER